MGIKLDPGNPLFGATEQQSPAFNADTTVIVSPQSMKNTVTMPGELSKLAESAKATEPKLVQAPPAAPDLTSLDFDLGLSTDPEFVNVTEKPETEETIKLPEPVLGTGRLDFDLADNKPAVSISPVLDTKPAVAAPNFDFQSNSTQVMPEPVEEKELASLDFDLGIEPHTPTVVTTVQSAEPINTNFVPEVPSASVDGDGVEFDVSLTESTFLGRSMPESNSFDMYAIDLDLQQPELPIAEPAPAKAVAPAVEAPVESGSEPLDSELVATAVNPDFGTAQAETVVNPQFGSEDMLPEFDINENEEVATKLDLAKAYEEMGDMEGARELLNEVLKEGDSAQKEKAKAILGKIGA